MPAGAWQGSIFDSIVSESGPLPPVGQVRPQWGLETVAIDSPPVSLDPTHARHHTAAGTLGERCAEAALEAFLRLILPPQCWPLLHAREVTNGTLAP